MFLSQNVVSGSSRFRSIASRIAYMTLVWCSIGLAAGICLALPFRSIPHLIAHALAGIIVTSGIGVVSGILGSRSWDTLAGAAIGAIAAIVAIAAQSADNVGMLLAFGLILGGIIASTFSVFLQLGLWFLAQLR